MLADEVVVVMIAVSVGTKTAQGAETLAVRLTDWPVRIETEAVFAFEEVGKGKVVGWRLWGFEGTGTVECQGRGSKVMDCGGHGVSSRRLSIV